MFNGWTQTVSSDALFKNRARHSITYQQDKEVRRQPSLLKETAISWDGNPKVLEPDLYTYPFDYSLLIEEKLVIVPSETGKSPKNLNYGNWKHEIFKNFSPPRTRNLLTCAFHMPPL